LGKIETLKAGNPLYHWASEPVVGRRIKTGKMSSAELESLDQNPGNAGGEQGGGLYISLDPFDSSIYGSTLMTLTDRQDLRVVNYNELGIAATAFGGMHPLHRALAKLGISASLEGARDLSSSATQGHRWLALFDPGLDLSTRKIDYPGLVNLFNQTSVNIDEPEALLRLLKIANEGPIDENRIQYDWNAHPLLKKLVEDRPFSKQEAKLFTRNMGYRYSGLLQAVMQHITSINPLALRVANDLLPDYELESVMIELLKAAPGATSLLTDKTTLAQKSPRLFHWLSDPESILRHLPDYGMADPAMIRKVMATLDPYLDSGAYTIFAHLKASPDGKISAVGSEAEQWWLSRHGSPHASGQHALGPH